MKALLILLSWVCFMLTLWYWSDKFYINAGIIAFCFVWNMRTLMKIEKEE
jgi:uncharacterized membrane protein (GlpM family)